MKFIFAALLAIMASIGSAECPDNPPITQALNKAYTDLKFAKFSAEAQVVTDELWRLWTQAPDGEAQRLLNSGMLRIRQGDLRAAQEQLSDLIAYCPNYAEGYNQRAFARYLAFDFEKALPDLAQTLSIQPRHLGALSGKGLTHLALGQEALAEIEFRKVLALNPFTPDQDLIQDLGTDL
ncbi:hypothetical protein N9D61_02560 [Planktomarina sp.]|nr:hypothetical protein [Planktomarina sp.]